MEIKIRDLDVRAVKVLDEEAKKQRVSRNVFLKRMVEDTVKFDGIKLAEKELDVTVSRVADGLEMTFKRLNQLEKHTLKLYLLLCDAIGLDPKEADYILEKTFGFDEKDGD
ncbi:hypothetical protein CIL03_10110 [Virgibacillus indicus]|uniref:Ribbon-helix-helix protein CopG domain-containing protein n=1 Tax=Virgibacillus indicus TaxID=2024554 RepID=A0A265N9D1_9BACI|nr:hypothetical protein [Virgibacillus indicus]OZU88640.1 hypothetical protein CIL03_10110 [Virgibacillus indicus]